MKKCLLCGLLFIFIFKSSASEIDIYKYSSTGKKGYSQFRNDIVGDNKYSFWSSFAAFIKSSSSQKKFKNILECQEFWKYYQKDGFFIAKDQDALFSREYDDVKNAFNEAVTNYWNNLLARMSRLEEINDKVEDVNKYTQNNDYSNILKSYITIYNELKSLKAPKGKVELDKFRNNFSKLLQAAGNVAVNITQPILDYFDSWEDYFSTPIPEGVGNYLAKSEAYKKKKEKLEIIGPLANKISLFNITNHVDEINKRKKDWESNEKYYAIHSEIDNLIESFKNSPLSVDEQIIVGKWDELMNVKNKVLTGVRERVMDPKPELLKKAKEFESIPSDVNMATLENFFNNHRDSTDKIATIVKVKFKFQFLQSIEQLWDKGQLNTCKNAVQKYAEYFGSCKYEKYFSFVNDYNSMKTDLDSGNRSKITDLYRFVKNYGFQKNDIDLIYEKWDIPSLRDLKNKYKNYVNEEAQKIFTKAPNERERNQSDFDNFLDIYRNAKKDMEDFSLDESYASKFSALYSYYHGKDENEKKSAEQDILKDPMLATAYGIEKPIPSIPTGRINPADISSSSVRMETGTTVASSQLHTDAYKILETLWVESKTRKMVDLIDYIIKNEKLPFASQGEDKKALSRLIEYKKNIDNGQINPSDKPVFLYMLSEILARTGNEGEQFKVLEQLKMLPDFSNFNLPAELDKGQINKSYIENQYEAIKYFNSVVEIYKKDKEKHFENNVEEGNFIKVVKSILNPSIFEKLQPAQDARLNYMAAMIYKNKTEKYLLACYHFYKCYNKMTSEIFEKLMTYEGGDGFIQKDVTNFLSENLKKSSTNAKEDFNKELIKSYIYSLMDEEYEGIKKLIPSSDNLGENQDYLDFLKATQKYIENAGKDYSGNFKNSLDKIFNEEENLFPGDFNSLKEKEKMPTDFDFKTYEFLRACYYKKNLEENKNEIINEFKENIESQKNEEIKGILQKIFDRRLKSLMGN